MIIATIAAAAAIINGLRLGLWRPWGTLHTPIVWILHVAYAWLVFALALRALAGLGLTPTSIATHALTWAQSVV